MYIPKRRSSLSQEINSHEKVFEEETEESQHIGCYLCTKFNNTRRRSSSSFKVGSFIDSLLIDRTSASKSEPVTFKFGILVTDFSYHIRKGGQLPASGNTKRVEIPFDVQYIEWSNASASSTLPHPATGGSTGGSSFSSPLVGNVEISKRYASYTSKQFPGFSIPYRSVLKLSIENTEGTTISICLLEYDLSKLPSGHKRLVRFKSNSIVIQILYFHLNKKFYVGDTARIVLLSKEEGITTNGEVIVINESKFDENHYKKCDRCQPYSQG
ncbi:hypothetical protein CLIB1423_03S02872 [[Candida] railenensis]|uniref:Uncharacterized protein n=1 Tax=[Candida] railenensis TaxID=45579 RepID=A0A9P0QM78_9ASCO|nr:hypothetical protein CLIB1423_03S02872 [[Candida] railenensis]